MVHNQSEDQYQSEQCIGVQTLAHIFEQQKGNCKSYGDADCRDECIAKPNKQEQNNHQQDEAYQKVIQQCIDAVFDLNGRVVEHGYAHPARQLLLKLVYSLFYTTCYRKTISAGDFGNLEVY